MLCQAQIKLTFDAAAKILRCYCQRIVFRMNSIVPVRILKTRRAILVAIPVFAMISCIEECRGMIT